MRFPSVQLVAACALLASGCTVDGDGTCVSERPLARSHAASVLVPSTNQLFLYGGIVPSEATRTLWRYRFGACSGWSSLAFDSSSGPAAVFRPAAAFDSKRHRIVYASATVSALDSDRLTWNELLTIGTPPTLTDHAWAVYDPDRDRLVVGGFGAAQLSFATSDQGQWQPIDFLTQPDRVETVTAAIDSNRSALYAFDGSHGTLHRYALFVDRPAAAPVTITGDPLPSDGEAHLGWNVVDERLYLFAGNGDVYSLAAGDASGDTLQSRRVPVTGERPPQRSSAAFGISGSFAVVFGGVAVTAAADGGVAPGDGCALDDTWSFSVDDNQWTAHARATTCL
jgi:hypothetical protein